MIEILNSIDQLVISIESNLSFKADQQTNQELIKLKSIQTKLNQHKNLDLKENILDYLSSLLLNHQHSSIVASSCSSILLDLLLHLKSTAKCDQVQLFYILSELISLFPEISEFVYSNYNQNFNPFTLVFQSNTSLDHPPSKRIKTDTSNLDGYLIKLLNACLNYLYFNSEWFISCWNWSDLFVHLNKNSQNKEINFLIYQCLRVIFNLSDNLFYSKLNQEFSQDTLIDLRLKYNGVSKVNDLNYQMKI